MLKYLHILCVTLLMHLPLAEALTLYTGSNTQNLTAPDSSREAIFNAVASVCDADGANRSGSAVYLRDKFILTANHIALRSHVTFDGITYWERDTNFTPIQIGSADLRILKLLENPGLTPIELQTPETGQDVSYLDGKGRNAAIVDVMGTIVGWGKGSAEDGNGFIAGNNHLWTWSGNYAKRWGTNTIDSSYPINSSASYNYTYNSLVTDLDTNAGIDDAALAAHDSGAALFIENDGVWRLAGIASLVQREGASYFSSSGGDRNYFVRISILASSIEAAIPDSSLYSGWQTNYNLSGVNTEPTADSDGDGIPQLLEFAFGGDPNKNDCTILPTQQFVTDRKDSYLELQVIRPIGIQGIAYTPQTTSDLNNWPSDATGIDTISPTAVDNGNGTETLTFRRSQPLADTGQAFIRVLVNTVP